MEVIRVMEDKVEIRLSRSDLVKIMSMASAVSEQFEALDPNILEVEVEDVERISDELLDAVKAARSLNS